MAFECHSEGFGIPVFKCMELELRMPNRAVIVKPLGITALFFLRGAVTLTLYCLGKKWNYILYQEESNWEKKTQRS